MLDTVKPADEPFEIWPENVEAIGLFVRLQTQWRIINGVVAGLDYQSIAVLMDIFSVSDRPTMFDDLQAMEAAALAAFNKGKD